MNNAKNNKMSKKKKILIIVFSIISFLLVAGIGGGLGALHWYCTPKVYAVMKVADEIVNDTDLKLIAHRGFNAVAPENTLPAFDEAGKKGYYGAECDIYRTKDGVWVITHDKYTYRMMDKNSNVQNKTYRELLEYTYDNGTNISKYPNLKILTLEEYLEVCKKYSMVAVIEIKGKDNLEYYNEITELVAKMEMDNKVTYISFNIESLKRIRELSNAPLWLLTSKVRDEDIQLAKEIGGECGIDFDGNKKENYEEIVKKCNDEGLNVGTWTINDNETLEKFYRMGVKMITTNCLTY